MLINYLSQFSAFNNKHRTPVPFIAKKVAPLRLRFSEVKVFLESTLTALRGFNRNAKVELS